ncbi:hypothetical protein [Mesorhizobium sp. M0195]|uniref:hypothetical protein n=1 Tax=unclassified Mesorhizobium TaxID=325217 RepID=UPI00333AF000
MRVTIVWNYDRRGVIKRFGQPSPEFDDREPVENVVTALQEGGHETLLCESDKGNVPAMIEMAGIPYTGPSPLGHGLALDKVITKRLIRDRGVPTPKFRVMDCGTEPTAICDSQ